MYHTRWRSLGGRRHEPGGHYSISVNSRMQTSLCVVTGCFPVSRSVPTHSHAQNTLHGTQMGCSCVLTMVRVTHSSFLAMKAHTAHHLHSAMDDTLGVSQVRVLQ